MTFEASRMLVVPANIPEVLKLWATPPAGGGAAVGTLRGRVDCMGDISILNEIWVQGKIYIL
jgi:hypothetical protein